MQKQGKVKRDGVINPQYYNFEMNFKHGIFDALKTLRINRSRPLNLATCAIGTSWSTSSDTHQVVEIQKDTSTKMYTQLKA